MRTNNHDCSVIISVLFLLIFFTAHNVSAKTVSFHKEYNYQASSLDNKASCRAIALEHVKMLLIDELGDYLINKTTVKDLKLTKEQVTALLSGVVGVEIIQEKWDSSTYFIKAKISADNNEVKISLKKSLSDKQNVKELEDSRKKAKDAMDKIESLKKQTSGSKESASKQKEYAKAVRELGAADWFEKGKVLTAGENHKEGISAYTRAIELDPKYYNAYNNRGNAYSDMGKYQHALNDFNKAIAVCPKQAEAYNNRGVIHDKTDKYQMAIADYNKAIELEPGCADAYFNRGIAFENDREYELAINDYSKAIELDPGYAKVYFNRGIVYENTGRYQEAIDDYSKAAEIDPQNINAYFNLARIYSLQNRSEKACDSLGKSIKNGFKNWGWLKLKDFDNVRDSFCYQRIMMGK